MPHERVAETFGRNEATAYLRMATLNGWPIWPSLETPKLAPWWDLSIQINPQAHIRDPNNIVIELAGMPNQGKTEITKILKQVFSTSKYWSKNGTEWLVDIADEDYLVSGKHGVDLLLFGKNPAQAFENGLVYPSEKDDWSWTYEVQLAKSWTWKHVANRIGNNSTNTRQIRIYTHGPVDTTLWFKALRTYQGDDMLKIPDYACTSLITEEALTQASLRLVDGVVVLGSNQATAKSHRTQKTRPGTVTDSPFYNELLAWYGVFVNNVFPSLRNKHGTGILIPPPNATIARTADSICAYIDGIIQEKSSMPT